MNQKIKKKVQEKESFEPKHKTEEYYFEKNLMIFTEAYHLNRGYCCKSGCRHCPYGYKNSDNF